MSDQIIGQCIPGRNSEDAKNVASKVSPTSRITISRCNKVDTEPKATGQDLGENISCIGLPTRGPIKKGLLADPILRSSRPSMLHELPMMTSLRLVHNRTPFSSLKTAPVLGITSSALKPDAQLKLSSELSSQLRRAMASSHPRADNILVNDLLCLTYRGQRNRVFADWTDGSNPLLSWK